MAILFTLVYPDHETAEKVMDTAKGLEDAGYVNILDQALVKKDADGKVRVDEEKHPVRRGGVVGGVIGGVVGAVFLIPVAGIAAGAAIGGLLGRAGKSGAHDDFKAFSDTIQREMQPGNAAVVMLAEASARDRAVHELGKYGGKLYSFDLSDDEVASIQRELDRSAG